MRTCKECDNNCEVLPNGVSHHINVDGNVDYGLDGEHVAIPELTDAESNMLNQIIGSVFNFHGDVPCINYAANGGGYEKYCYFICADGGCLGISTVINEFKKVNFNDPDDKQWYIVGVEVNYENTELVDEHTGDYIPAAYSEY